MSNLSFNKNSFIKSEPAKLSKTINNCDKFGVRTIEEIKKDMHSLNKPEVELPKSKIEDLQKNNINNLNSLKVFRQWNKK